MRKILLVEDDSMSRDLLARRLRNKGFQVVTAVDGAQAVTLAREVLPDLVVMDMNLPVKDGLQATLELKACRETQHIPIIALTGQDRPRDREQALMTGCIDFESKPLSFKRLHAKIGELLGPPE
jgi:CheY-like chemotaxis protein